MNEQDKNKIIKNIEDNITIIRNNYHNKDSLKDYEKLSFDSYSEVINNTPERIFKSYKEIFSGYNISSSEVLEKQFEKPNESQESFIAMHNIEFYSMCEHHMLPFFGTVSIGYIANEKIVGLSKLPRVVDVFAKRLQLQERLTSQIGMSIEDNLKPKGVIVSITAQHFCVMMRGVSKANSTTTTMYCSGDLKDSQNIYYQQFLKDLR
jgi:GTP cyclohydrolase I